MSWEKFEKQKEKKEDQVLHQLRAHQTQVVPVKIARGNTADNFVMYKTKI